MKTIPDRVRTLSHLLARLMAGIIYLSFFLVQFDIHLGGAPQDISWFAGDSNTAAQIQAVKYIRNVGVCQKTKTVHFRLNKRFHPEKFFEASFPQPNIRPVASVSLKIHFESQEPVLGAVDHLSRRGPPELV